MGQTPHGAPWPDPASPTRDGAAAIRALAEWTDLRAPWQVYATSGGYTTNQFGGVAITVPFASAVLGVAQMRTSGGVGIFLQSSNGAPANTYWLNAYSMSAGSPSVANTFIVIDVIVMGY
jgi:hypothetical protein